MAFKLNENLERIWYSRTSWSLFLTPLSWLYCFIVCIRRKAYGIGLFKATNVGVPVIVVGNITVGGTGKTPLVIWLAQFLRESGYRPGIVSRGYGGKASKWPQQVRPDSDAFIVGDEAIVISRRTQCPMAVGPDRVADARALLEHQDCDVILSDDGLQHYALHRQIEIATIDGTRRFGNGRCLPAGPLREPSGRLNDVDLRVVKGISGPNEYAMTYYGEHLVNLVDESLQVPLSDLQGQEVHAVAGIGNPEAFFSVLAKQGARLTKHVFPDHHLFLKNDLQFDEGAWVIMTEKDAVKCRRFENERFWYLPVDAQLPKGFGIQLLNFLESRNG